MPESYTLGDVASVIPRVWAGKVLQASSERFYNEYLKVISIQLGSLVCNYSELCAVLN